VLMLAALFILGSIALVGWSIYRLFAMWILDKVIDGVEFVVILSLMSALLAGALVVGGPVGLGLLVLLALVSLMITAMPAVRQAVGARQLKAQDIAKYYEALERQPDVPYPHRKLGEIYQAREDWERAIEHYQAYLELHKVSGDVQYQLEKCLEARRRRDMGLRRCPVCGADSRSDATRCEECGFYLKGGQEIIDTLTTPDMMRLWKWLIVAFLVPALVIAIFARVIPPIVSLVMLMCSVVATLIFVYGRMRGSGRT